MTQEQRTEKSSYDYLSEISATYLNNRFDQTSKSEVLYFSNEVDWAEILVLARRHGIRPILLKATEHTEVPKTYRDLLVNQCRKIIMSNFNLLREKNKIADYLIKQQLKHEHLKGVTLAIRAFDDIGMREMSDIDILLHPDDIESVGQFLMSRGYQAETQIPKKWMWWYMYNNCEYNYDYYKNEHRKFHVEPHWFLGTRVLQMNIGLSDLYKYWNPEDGKLPPELLLITVCAHHGTDMCRRLKYVVDIYAIIAKYKDVIDWDHLLHISRDLKMGNIVLLCIDQVIEEFHIDLPNRIQELIKLKISRRLSSDIMSQRAQYMPSQKKLGYHFKRFRFQLLVRERVSTRLKVLWNIFIYYVMFRFFIPKSIRL